MVIVIGQSVWPTFFAASKRLPGQNPHISSNQ
jgi:hypothetical protein